MSLPRLLSHASPALPSYQASSVQAPPCYSPRDGVETLAVPAPVYTARPDRFTLSAPLEAGFGPSLPPLLLNPQHPASGRRLDVSDIATLACLGGAGLVALTLPAVPGIAMVAVGHQRGNAALQWAGVTWLGGVGILIVRACIGGRRP